MRGGCNLPGYIMRILLCASFIAAVGSISEKHFEMQGTVFSPEGRLYQVSLNL
jgi:hypothetical protein